jgi:hypothetical protein
MATVTTPLAEQAESIFTDLGYTVSTEGPELRAERKWRVVHVRVGEDPASETEGELQCFVTWDDRADEVHDRIAARDPDYEWAVLGVRENGEYECYRQRPRDSN